ncbi:MAG: MFS transporter [Oscillospiraceae bacterium]|nr:MFS transporter [Oscillospiraceae bacterium]
MKTLVRKHYHWLVAAIIFCEMFVYGGIVTSISIYTIPITEGLSVDRGPFTLTEIPYGVLSFISAMGTGWLLRKFGYKTLTIGSLMLTSAGLMIMGVSPDLVGQGIGRGLIGLGYGACFTAGCVWIIKQWFHGRQGLVVGAVSMASGFGGSAMSFVFSRVIVKFGWRTALLIEGTLPIAIAFLYLLIYNAPEKIGLLPYGKMEKVTKKMRQESNWEGFSMKEQYRNPLLYIMCAATLLSAMCVYATHTVLNPHFQDNGYSQTAAASYSSMLMLIVAFVKLLLGWISDRYGAKLVALMCLGCAAVGQWMLSDVSNPVLSYIGVGLFAVGLCLTSIAIPLIAFPLFGYWGSAEVNGIVVGMASLAHLITAPICNFIFDYIGSYSPSFRVAAILEVCLIPVYLIMFAMADKQRKKELDRKNIGCP